jgi:hypothetical protein
VIEWLLTGDSVIRWQVMRDLLDEPPAIWEHERRRTIEAGWVAGMLARRSPTGVWPKGRWTDSVWALLLLVACGLPEDHPDARVDTARMLDRLLPDSDVGCRLAQMRRSLPPRLLARSRRLLPRRRRAPPTPRRHRAKRTAGRRGLGIGSSAWKQSSHLPSLAETARSTSRLFVTSESVEWSKSLMNRSVAALVWACVLARRIRATSARRRDNSRLARAELPLQRGSVPAACGFAAGRATGFELPQAPAARATMLSTRHQPRRERRGPLNAFSSTRLSAGSPRAAGNTGRSFRQPPRRRDRPCGSSSGCRAMHAPRRRGTSQSPPAASAFPSASDGRVRRRSRDAGRLRVAAPADVADAASARGSSRTSRQSFESRSKVRRGGRRSRRRVRRRPRRATGSVASR